MNNKNLDDFAIETSAMQSDGSSDGFSLVDDGDSLVGSEVYVESEVASSTATPATVATFAGGEPIIVPQETDAVWWGKTFVLVTWVLVTIVESVVVYFSTRPGLNVVAVVVFAVVLLMVFFTFDHRVDLRHKAVINEALRTRKIVSSLFPPVVHDRLFQSNNPSEVLDVAQSPEYRRAIANIAPFEDVAEKGNRTMTEDPQTNGGNNDIETPIIQRAETMGTSTRSLQPPTQRLRNFLTDDLPAQSEHSDKATNKDEPIADLFPEATVMFADISGFTAWSSVREPSQVFKLLETIYRSFDRIAKKRSVFKVETIGDCYVAVTGLPDPQPDHAVVMVKFAKECMQKMNELTRKLEVSLGPETGDLCMRFGLHSGPVTAGVLRGEKSRFQLFGDTVNFASRMESTGQRNKIQASQATADLLIESGKRNWVHPRDELVNAKGKGQVKTFWIQPRSNSGSSRSIRTDKSDSMVNLKSKRKGVSLGRDPSNRSTLMNESATQSRRSLLSISQHSQIWSADDNIDIDYDGFDDGNRQERLIDWNVEILTGLLKRIVAHRRSKNVDDSDEDLILEPHTPGKSLEEITEIIPILSHKPDGVTALKIDSDTVELDTKVEDQLREYVTMVACMYRDNFFHNFEHASHVLMSAQKLLKRVIIADKERVAADEEIKNDYIRGIASDPLTQFAIVFSALLHDLDHTGVPNSQLVRENAHIATLYKNKSIAEQNSLDLAWDLLMDRNYRALQSAIFSNQSELDRFRQLVVNVVLATDIFDPDQVAIRNSRFEKAFQNESLESPLDQGDYMNLKATIVIEFIMQASDVSHTMQHWHVYRTWNEKLFEEMYSAYQVNRGEKDPSIGWYKGELWFFDNYIIPLARKLKECGVFGPASDECLIYALDNRKEWAAKGEELVQNFVAKHTKA